MSNNILNKKLIEKLKENRPGLTENSMKTYLSNFNTIRRVLQKKLEEPSDFVKYKDEILEYFRPLSNTTKKTRLAGVISLLKGRGKDDEDIDPETIDAIKDYTDLMNATATEYDDFEKNQELTPKMKEHYLPWETILKVYSKLHMLAKPLMKVPPDQVTPDIFDIIQHYILLSMYVLIPPRRARDYIYFKIRNFDTSDKSIDNYMLKAKGKKTVFVFNTYKNSTRLGTQYIDVPRDLVNMIEKWKTINPHDYLLVGKVKNKRLQDNKIYGMLNEIFKRNLGPSLLRHAFLTYKYGNVDLEDIERTANLMGSSGIVRTLKYVNKEEKKEE